MKFPIVFKQNGKILFKKNSYFSLLFLNKMGSLLFFFMTEENKNIVPDLTDMDEVRRAIIAGEIINRKY